jgi:hypothetical protein
MNEHLFEKQPSGETVPIQNLCWHESVDKAKHEFSAESKCLVQHFCKHKDTRCAWAGGREFLIHDSRGFLILKNN